MGRKKENSIDYWKYIESSLITQEQRRKIRKCDLLGIPYPPDLAEIIHYINIESLISNIIYKYEGD